MKQEMSNKVRIDKYLWAIRLFKTRSLAASFCSSGKIQCHGISVKASYAVKVGDQFSIRMDKELTRVVEVLEVIALRKSFEQIKHTYKDLTKWPEKKDILPSAFLLRSEDKNHRPTKKKRRAMDNFLNH